MSGRDGRRSRRALRGDRRERSRRLIAFYTIQIDDSHSFSAPPTAVSTVVVSQFGLPTTRMWWRVRANDGAGAPGAWSVVRRVEVKR
jgi:hypothetical protein